MAIPLPAHDAAPWLAPAAWTVARCTVLLALAALAALSLRRRSASARHLAWALGLLGMLALPALSLVAPAWEVSFVSVDALEAVSLAVGAPSSPGGLPWGTLVLAVWMTGAAAALARFGLALLAVGRVARRAVPVTDAAWLARMRSGAREIGLRGDVRLLRAEGAAMPMTWGILRPTVLIPSGGNGWTEERRRVVLLHELAHVARRDCLWQALASLACAAFWFHPGAWWAARMMRIEREQACDDRVLAAGTRASDYAGHLLDVARAFRPHALTGAAAVAMARRSQLEGRVVAVLDAARARGAVPARMALVAGGLAAVVLFPLAAAVPRMEERVVVVRAPLAVPAPRAVEAEVEAPVITAVPAAAPIALAPPERRRTAPAPRASVAAAPLPRVDDDAPVLLVGDEATVAALVRATRDTDPGVRRSAIWALGKMEGDAAVAPLVAAMGDADARVRSAAAMALGERAQRGRPGALAQGAPLAAVEREREPLRGSAGTAAAPGPARTARTDMNGRRTDTALRILGSVNAVEDSVYRAGGSPGIIPGADM